MTPTKIKRPTLVKVANTKLDEVRATLAWIFEVANLQGDTWTAATVTAALRVLGSDDTNSKAVVVAKARGR